MTVTLVLIRGAPAGDAGGSKPVCWSCEVTRSSAAGTLIWSSTGRRSTPLLLSTARSCDQIAALERGFLLHDL